jgi:hypothetical protein
MSRMSNMQSMFQANPTLMSKLLLGETADLGEGLSMKLLKTGFYTMLGGTTFDSLEFEFFLEGKSVGTLDHEFGGWIEGVGTENEKLFEQVSFRFIELFKSHAKKVLVLP